ncbi:1,4-dihydroxy-2-naphthoate octaprenyltransferase [Ulvibacter litoralis]|uniref:1,4-dihydroxy-2-naphthoate octaprenyltransferase n=1 Tax=Ulvibacter litoralis TaxID=227084 RepID=A0A1G7I4A0_9FLAO|nr:1,4-dihydroxy-2-naphthoate octaprenyltransferase [Ulvibacter litoralis]GHC62623.1 1,4-dihydroxy-2-naphthoate octaprenyltransferase [Ulvibacter litoralis]SDF07214.1 1,4-dihydroxy-2-naphthoate octaprenyltransferase [Ulvibacter litoralis]
MSKIKVWVSAARLRTLPLSISGIVTGAAAAMQVGQFSKAIFFLALATTLGFQILSNFANDYGDGMKGTDNNDRVGPARAFQSGLLTAKQLKRGMIITAAITLLLVSLLVFTAFGSNNMLLSVLFFNLGIAAVIAAVKYTVGESAYGYKALGDVFVFLFFGLVGVMGSYFLFTQQLNHFILLPAITIGFLSAAVLNLNNMRDRLADAKVNKNTLAVVLGVPNVKHYHTFLILGAFVAALFYFYATESTAIQYAPLVAFIPLFLNILKVYKNEVPKELDPELKKVALSTFLYAVLFFGTTLI